MFQELSKQLGASPDQIKLVLLIVISVPLSLVFPYLPSSTRSNLPHLYAALPSLVYLCFVLDLRWGCLQLVLSSVATWLIATWGVKTKQGKRMPWMVFTVVMGHLAVNHIIRHLEKTTLDVIEITGSQMVLCMKLISFAWSVYDGQQPVTDLDPTQRRTKIDAVPGLIPFLGYALFFPSILAGPSFTFSSYEAFTSHSLFMQETGASKVSPVTSTGVSRNLIPAGRRRKAAKRFITGAVYLTIYSLYGWQYGYHRMLEPAFTVKSPLQRIGFMQLAGFVARTKYYAVWCIAESAFIVSGLGYNPATNHYDASRNVRIRSIELAPNFKILLDSWNMNTNVWLRECIYKRVTRKGRKPGFKSTQITFITSALWHGVNPCYLMTFVLGGFCQSLGRSLRSLVRPFFLPAGSVPPPVKSSKPATNLKGAPVAAAAPDTPSPAAPPKKIPPPPQTPLKWIYDGLGIIATQLALNFAVAPFMLLSIDASLAAWRAVYFYGLIIVGVPIFVLKAGLAQQLKSALRKRDAKAHKTADDEERKRLEWEAENERKRKLRGEGIASMGLDVEQMLEEEEREERRQERDRKKEL